MTQVFSDRRDLFHSRPILVAEENAARRRFESAFDAHRALFPAALAYTQIVPVDVPGSTSANLKTLPYEQCGRPIFPLDEGVVPPFSLAD